MWPDANVLAEHYLTIIHQLKAGFCGPLIKSTNQMNSKLEVRIEAVKLAINMGILMFKP
jgi:hypothetical protein